MTASCCCSTCSLLHTTGHVRGVHVMLMSGGLQFARPGDSLAVQYNPMYQDPVAASVCSVPLPVAMAQGVVVLRKIKLAGCPACFGRRDSCHQARSHRVTWVLELDCKLGACRDGFMSQS